MQKYFSLAQIGEVIPKLLAKEINGILIHVLGGSKGYELSEINEQTLNNYLILCGSFNPLHKGHIALAGAAFPYAQNVQTTLFELSLHNCDKGQIDCFEYIQDRIDNFPQNMNILLSNSPLYHEKAKFINNTFVIGADTFSRILEHKYYVEQYNGLIQSLDILKENNINFIVGGRYNEGKQEFQSLSTFKEYIPESYEDLFIELPEDKFRMDLSSTELRAKLRTHFIPKY